MTITARVITATKITARKITAKIIGSGGIVEKCISYFNGVDAYVQVYSCQLILG